MAVISTNSMIPASERFSAYRHNELAQLRNSGRNTENMLISLKEKSCVDEYKRNFANNRSGSKRPQSFLRGESPTRTHVKSRVRMVSRLRKLEKRQLWLQTTFMAIWQLLSGFSRLNPFRSFADQTRFRGRQSKISMLTPTRSPSAKRQRRAS